MISLLNNQHTLYADMYGRDGFNYQLICMLNAAYWIYQMQNVWLDAE